MDDAPTHSANPWPAGGLALVIGASGGIGAALLAHLQADLRFARVLGLSRRSEPALDLLNEASIARAAAHVAGLGLPLRLLIDATGLLHSPGQQPEKSWQQLDPVQMAQAFAVNAIGPALLMKHFLPLLPRQGHAVFVTLSAKVGSIGDNHLGGWYSYRASKAALNQLVHTAAIEHKTPTHKPAALNPSCVCHSVHYAVSVECLYRRLEPAAIASHGRHPLCSCRVRGPTIVCSLVYPV